MFLSDLPSILIEITFCLCDNPGMKNCLRLSVLFILLQAGFVQAQDYGFYQLPQTSVTDRSMSNTIPLQNGAFVHPLQVTPGVGMLAVPQTGVDEYMRLSGNSRNTNISINTMPSLGSSRDVLGAIMTPLFKPLPMQPLSPSISWLFNPDGSAAKMTVFPDGSTNVEYFEPTRAPRGIMRNVN